MNEYKHCIKGLRQAGNLWITVLVVLLAVPLAAQQSDREFAEYYYQQREYDKAILYFESLYDKSQSELDYKRLFDSYLQTERLEDARDLSQKHSRKSRSRYLTYVDIGHTYLLESQDSKAEKYFVKALDEAPSNRGAIGNLAKKFADLGAYDMAEKTYNKGQEDPAVGYGFHLEMASLYGAQGKTGEMITSYLDLLLERPQYLQSVKNAFLRYLNFTDREEESELLRRNLLHYAQQYPESLQLSELMIWYFYQVKNFDGAFIQIRALDKRYQEDGSRLLSFAQLCVSNEHFSLAADVYQYILDNKGPELQQQVRGLKAKAQYAALQKKINPDTEALERVSRAFRETLEDLQVSSLNAHVYLDYSDFLFRYEHQTDSSASILQEIIDAPGVYDKIQAHAKLRLADIWVVQRDIWEASLLYSQVDKAYKNDPLGAVAKFKNAKIAYYTGDFAWAQAQLDVLKASTSKLISNDALDLSLLITDNLALDSVYEPMEMYARAELLTFQNRYEEALATLDSITTQYPGHSLSDEILYEKYEIAYKRQQYDSARQYLEDIVQFYGSDLFGDNAIYTLGQMHEAIFNDPDKAAGYYKTLMTDFPGSLFVVEARKRFRALRGDQNFTE